MYYFVWIDSEIIDNYCASKNASNSAQGITRLVALITTKEGTALNSVNTTEFSE